MMKMLLKNFTLIMGLFILTATGIMAQEEPAEVTYTLDPTTMIPADTGYFKAGACVDKVGNDGICEQYSGCFDAYGDASHKEAGEQQGFTYHKVIIFPNCSAALAGTADYPVKGTPPTEDWPAAGQVQLGKHKYIGTDSAEFGYIQSPRLSNLRTLEVKVSTDVSINNNRQIYMLIEISTDGGETWALSDLAGDGFIHIQLANQGGETHYFEAGSNSGFDAMVAASQTSDILIRVIPYPALFTDGTGERLKIWSITIEASEPASGGVTGIGDLKADSFIVKDGNFIAKKGELYVYSVSGKILGSGQQVKIPGKGLFIIRTSDDLTARKIFIK